MTEEWLSTRQIGDVLGVGNKTVHRDQRATVSNDTLEPEGVAVDRGFGGAVVSDDTLRKEAEADIGLRRRRGERLLAKLQVAVTCWSG